MPREVFELRVPFLKLLIGVLVTLLPLSLLGVYTMSAGADRLQEEIGGHYETIASGIASQVAQFIRADTTQVVFMAADPTVREAVEAVNREDGRMSAAALTTKIQRIEQNWNTPESEALVKGILSSPASETLRRYLELDPAFLRISVTGQEGYTVAASHRTIDYYQADEEFWQDIFAAGHGAISLTDILYDEPSQSNYIGIGVPIVEPGSNRVIGFYTGLLGFELKQKFGSAIAILAKDDLAVSLPVGAVGRRFPFLGAAADAGPQPARARWMEPFRRPG